MKAGICVRIGGTLHAISGLCAALRIKSGTSADGRLLGAKEVHFTTYSQNTNELK
jgi:hypothetical protein